MTVSPDKVRGRGVFANAIRGMLKKSASAANAYLSRFGANAPFGTGMIPGGAGGSLAHRAYAALRPGRTDQGMDFGGAGPVGAIANGRVLRNSIWPGWPGTGGLVYTTPNGNVYIMEDFAPSVRAGQAVQAGQVLGQATGGPSGIETGWANASATGPLTPYAGHADGTPMPGGLAFRKFIGYAQGGIIGSLGSTGSAILGGLTNVSDPIDAQIANINRIVGPDGSVAKLGDLLSYWQGIWGLDQNVSSIMSGGPSAAVITQDPITGQPVTPYIDQASVNLAIARLSQEVDWEGTTVGDLRTALTMAQKLSPKLQAAIKKAQERVKKIRAQIQANLKKIAAYRKQQENLQKMINTERGKKKPNWKAIATWKNQILGLHGKIGDLENQNYQLGGNKTVVGTGGEIGQLNSEIKHRQAQLQNLQGLPDQIGGAGGSGLGGELGPAQVSLAQYSQQLAALSPSALAQALANASSQTAPQDNSALISLLEQQNQILAGNYAVSQAQYQVLSGPMFGLPPFGGSFANGGIVPGPPGVARTVIAHGGEVIGQPGNVEVHLHGDLGNFVRAEIRKEGRKQSITARRRLPGQPGVLLTQ